MTSSTELASRVFLTGLIVGVFIDFSVASSGITLSTASSDPNLKQKDEKSALDSPVAISSQILGGESPLEERRLEAETRYLEDSSEAGILLPYDDDFPRPGGSNPRLLSDEDLPQSVSFPGRPIGLRVSNGKALEQPRETFYGADPGKAFLDDLKKTPTYFVKNNCFGPRCLHQTMNRGENYFESESKAKKYDRSGSRSNNALEATTKYEDNVMESMSSNFHSQLAIPFMVVDAEGNPAQKFSNRNGLLDRLTPTQTPTSPEGWVKLKAISPDVYDPFRLKNNSLSDSSQSTFSKRDSSNASKQLTKRVGVELNPQSFADRWGYNDDRRGGSRLPAWLEEQLNYGNGNGNRNSDQDKNWVKLEPIPVAGVTISKWVPKGTPVSDLPTTSWQNNRDRPNAGNPWWDRIDDNRPPTSNSRPPFTTPSFLRPGADDTRYGNSGGNRGGWNDKGQPLSNFDRYPTNSWNDIIYPEGPQSATVSWQQSKGGPGNRPSSFGGGSGGGWSSSSETRRPQIATGSWSAPNNNRLPSYLNRFNDHRSSHPSKQASEDDPRWVLISNTRRVTSGSPNYNRGSDLIDRSKILSYINRLHPDLNLNRRGEYPFHDTPTSHRNGKDYWPYKGGLATSAVAIDSKDEAFHKVNATLSTLTPVLVHRGGTLDPSRFGTPALESDDDYEGDGEPNVVSSTIAPPTSYSTYVGDSRGTTSFQTSTTTPIRKFGRIRQGLRQINPVYAAVGAGMIPATLAAVMPMMLGRRRRRDVRNNFSQSLHFPYFLPSQLLYRNNNAILSKYWDGSKN